MDNPYNVLAFHTLPSLLQAEINRLVREKDDLAKQKEKKLDVERESLNRIKTQGQEITSLNRQIRRWKHI